MTKAKKFIIIFISVVILLVVIISFFNNLQIRNKTEEVVNYFFYNNNSSTSTDVNNYKDYIETSISELQDNTYFKNKIIDEVNKYSEKDKWDKLNIIYDIIYDKDFKSNIKEITLNYLSKEKEIVINTNDFSEIKSYIYHVIEYNEKFNNFSELNEIKDKDKIIEAKNELTQLFFTHEQLASKISELLEPIIIKDGMGGYYDDKKDKYKGYNNSERIGVVYHADISSYKFYGDILVKNIKEYWQDTIQDENTALNQKMLDNNGRKDITIYYYKENSINVPNSTYFDNAISATNTYIYNNEIVYVKNNKIGIGQYELNFN